MKLLIDDTNCELKGTVDKKVGEAINQAISELPRHRIVTKLTINGSRLNSANSNPLLDESMESPHLIEIKTADTLIWAATGYDVALSCIERIQKSVIKSAELFRDSDKLNGNRLFVQCIEGLERFIEALTITKVAINLDFSRLILDGISLVQLESELQQILKTIFNLQEKEDYLGLADKIEYELLTNLSNWSHLLKQLRAQQNANG
jgi:hypothetical protein